MPAAGAWRSAWMRSRCGCSPREQTFASAHRAAGGFAAESRPGASCGAQESAGGSITGTPGAARRESASDQGHCRGYGARSLPGPATWRPTMVHDVAITELSDEEVNGLQGALGKYSRVRVLSEVWP